MICPVWGAAEVMACPYGCRPATRLLTDHETLELVLDSFSAGGGPLTTETIDALRRLSAQADILPVLATILRGEPDTDAS
ncbi:hypothetical protein AB0M43_36730 [Longispora sp. NPDC051575]|uniref:hypothetical protein n=1 Tax=Longispora sp. NPDC051575 TaxID=3154943 RepID=UPI00342C7DB9